MEISKLDAGKQLLNFAVEKYFNGDEVLPLMSIAGASHVLLHDLVEKLEPNKTWAQQGAEGAGYTKRQVLKAIRTVPNWLKHADNDSETLLTISNEELEFLLFHAMLDLGELMRPTEIHSNEVSVFQIWFVAKYKHLFKANDYHHLVSEANEHFPILSEMELESQLNLARSALKKIRKVA